MIYTTLRVVHESVLSDDSEVSKETLFNNIPERLHSKFTGYLFREAKLSLREFRHTFNSVLFSEDDLTSPKVRSWMEKFRKDRNGVITPIYMPHLDPSVKIAYVPIVSYNVLGHPSWRDRTITFYRNMCTPVWITATLEEAIHLKGIVEEKAKKIDLAKIEDRRLNSGSGRIKTKLPSSGVEVNTYMDVISPSSIYVSCEIVPVSYKSMKEFEDDID